MRRSVLFWDIIQRRVYLCTDVSRQGIGPIFKGQEVQELLDHWTLRNIPKERRSHPIYPISLISPLGI
jgi:hypothetical protein